MHCIIKSGKCVNPIQHLAVEGGLGHSTTSDCVCTRQPGSWSRHVLALIGDDVEYGSGIWND
eukprot:7903956-Prorocentrum_lima.AAC.1